MKLSAGKKKRKSKRETETETEKKKKNGGKKHQQQTGRIDFENRKRGRDGKRHVCVCLGIRTH